jgi:hypothetical protein
MQCSTATNLGGWELGRQMNTAKNWICVFQALSTEREADFFVDRHALGEVTTSCFRELPSQNSAAKQFG